MTPMRAVARREKRRNASRRSSGASGQTTKAIWTRPPIQSEAAPRCAQSAKADSDDEPGPAAEWPESESPEAKPSASRKAGHKNARQSKSQPRNKRALTSANPSVI